MKCLALLFPNEGTTVVANLQVPIELIYEPRVDVPSIEQAHPSSLMKSMVDEINGATLMSGFKTPRSITMVLELMRSIAAAASSLDRCRCDLESQCGG